MATTKVDEKTGKEEVVLDEGDDLTKEPDTKDRGDDNDGENDGDKTRIAPGAEEEESKVEEKVEEKKEDETKAEEKKEDETKAEEKAEEEPAKKPNLFMVPKSRYDSVKTRLEAAQAKINELETKGTSTKAAETATTATDAVKELDGQLDKLAEDYTKAVADGDHGKAASIRGQERKLERQRTDALVDQRSALSTYQATEAIRYDTTVKAVEEQFPQLNPDDKENYDTDAAAEVLDVAAALEGRGYTPSDAVIRAVAYVVGSAKLASELGGTPAKVEAKAEEKPGSAKEADRKAAAIDKKIEASNKQPPSLKKIGTNSDKQGASDTPDFSKLSDSEIDALPESVKKRARGDMA